jgi:demethylmenaquinone methyltransferase/2-methoxy-6-polyprenyl-1,4-benzoquinol methylase
MPSSSTPRKQHAIELFSGLPARYDQLGSLLSFGQDPRWRAAMVARVPVGPGDRVLDVATGTGMVAQALVQRTGCRVVGLDQSEAMLASARARLAADPALAERIELVQGEAEQLPFDDASFDALTFTYLLRYVADPAATIAELARVVRPGGPIASLEFAVPPMLGWRAAWWLYTRAILPIAGLATGGRAWFDVGRFLGPSISSHYRDYPIAWTLEAWRHAGIDAIAHRSMSLGGGLVVWGVRRP